MPSPRLFRKDVTRVGGVPMTKMGLDDAVEDLLDRATSPHPRGTAVRLVNSYSIALAHRNRQYCDLLRTGGVNLPDGRPVSLIIRVLSGYSGAYCRGPSLFEQTLDQGRSVRLRHYLIGGTPRTLAALTREISIRWPGCEVVGIEAPPFRDLSADELKRRDDAVLRSRAHIVWVGLGTPKQDFEAQRLANACGVVAVGVGAAFDFTSGEKPSAPRWVQRIWLEWLFRLLTEPRRLWYRYLWGNSKFFAIAARDLRILMRHLSRHTR